MMHLHRILKTSLLGSICLAFLLISGAAKAQALSGSYTIDPKGSGATNFTSFKDAVDALKSKGVNSSVVFDVAPGTYTEQVTIPAISGASAKNTITFDGQDRGLVTLEYNATSSTMRHTWQFNSSEYVTVQNMTIQGLGKSYGWVVHFYSAAHYNSVISCDILADSTTNSQNFIPVIVNGSTSSYSSSTATHDILVDDCYLSGGYYGVYIASSSGTGHWIKNSYIKDAYYAGVYMSSSSEIKCINNIVDFPKSRYTSSYGFYFINGSSKSNTYHEITGNQIRNAKYSGMTFHTVHNQSTYQGVISNNMVGGAFRNGSNGNGIFMNLCSRWDVHHNTIDYSATASSTTSTGLYINGGTAPTDVRNNNLVMSATSGSATPAYFITASRFNYIDYNNYYNAADSTNLLYLDGTLGTANFKGSLGFNENSSSEQMTFVASDDLHLVANNPPLFGDASVNILKDIDGDQRCPIGPTPGADEATYTNIVLSPNFDMPDTITLGTPFDVINTSTNSVPVRFNWKYNGTKLSSDKDIRFAFNNLGADSLQLEIESCYGTKKIYKSIYVIAPAGPPKSNYVSDINETFVDGPVKFNDLSTGGPAAWNWEVVPATVNDPQQGTIPSHRYINNTNANSQFPEMVFAAPGEYTVCLTASNVKGSGNKACKSKYIVVYDNYTMCSSVKKARQSKGYLFDEGGPTGNYTQNRTGNNVCTFTIAPCNSQRTVLYLNNFDLRTNDYLRVYDGDDASGTPIYDHQHYPYGLTGKSDDPNFPDSLVAKSGKIFIQFESDNNSTTVGPGFEAFWSAQQPNLQPPTASFDAPDTICSNVQANFMSTTQGDELTYSWDLDGDGFEDASTKDALWVFFGGGTYDISLTVTGCGGDDKITRKVVVIDPVAEPGADFIADAVVAGTDDVVTLENKTTGCGEAYSWAISPSTFDYAPGYNKNSVSPKVIFHDSGKYTVTLTAVNSIGFKVETKTDYITVIKYCKPAISGYRKDIGISRVALKDIDNVTEVDQASGYVNFTSGMAAHVERGAKYTVRVDRPNGPNEVNRGLWIDFNQDGDFDDADELAGMDTNSTDVSWDIEIQIPATASLGATRMRVGTVTSSETITPCGPHSLGEYEDYRLFIGKDVTPPVITLKGKDTVEVEIGTTYKDSGATAMDNVDGDVTSGMSVIDAVDTSVPDTNVVIFTAVDAAGNKTIKYRYVIVLPDDKAPIVDLIGADTVHMDVHTSYTDDGITYNDLIDGKNLDISIDNQIDTAKLGTYRYTYYVSDKTGNTSTVTRIVIVEDNESPVASFAKGDTVEVEVNYPYLESDLTITDNYDSVFAIARSGSFNFADDIPTVLDTFSLMYTITDQSGNTTTIMRFIKVIDTTAPRIKLLGNDVVHILRWHTYTDSGYTVTDNYDTNPNVVTSGNFDNTLMTGTFYIKYTATDQSGNQSETVTRIIIVDENSSVGGTVEAGYSINAYPNPSDGRFVIETDLPNGEQVRMALYDMEGREIRMLRDGLGAQPRYNVDMSAEARGIYLLRVDTRNKTTYHKIVIVK